MSNLKVTIVQTSLYWENINENIKMFSKKLDGLKEKTDLVVLPEMFTTGFTMNAESFSEDMNGEAVRFLKKYSKKLNAAVCGSVIIKSGQKYYNRFLFCSLEGKLEYYDKRHLFRMGNENLVYSKGNKHLILKIKNWRIALFICYDLRFPVWCRNENNYDAAVFIANWPEQRNFPWKSLLVSRAIENQSYIIGVNRTGRDGNGVKYSGRSAILNPIGRHILNCNYRLGVYTKELDKKALDDFREKFPVYKDSDKFKIIL
jgi:omega-amidase